MKKCNVTSSELFTSVPHCTDGNPKLFHIQFQWSDWFCVFFVYLEEGSECLVLCICRKMFGSDRFSDFTVKCYAPTKTTAATVAGVGGDLCPRPPPPPLTASPTATLGKKAMVEFRVHRVVLAARCAYFAALFSSDVMETQQGWVLIEDLASDVVQALLEFLYTGTVEFLYIYNYNIYMRYLYNLYFPCIPFENYKRSNLKFIIFSD